MEEIISILNNKQLDSKCNNYIFAGLPKADIENVLLKTKDECVISNPDVEVINEIEKPVLSNIKIDMNKVESKEVLSYSLNYLGIHKKIEITKKSDLCIFRGMLREYQKAVQLIIYNIENFTLNDQVLINHIYWFNSYFFNINILTKNENLVTYKVDESNMLDYRENYIKVINRK